MDADDFRDYMLSFLFLRYLSDNYEAAAKKELGSDYPAQIDGSVSTPLQLWYESQPGRCAEHSRSRCAARCIT
jgi:type I restriction enzyme M protein